MSENAQFEGANKKEPSVKDEIFDWVQNITVILSAIVLIFIFLFRIVGVDGNSMYPTLHHKDWLITSNLFYEPEKGDVVILSKESFRDGEMIVKRVIATEGQEVDYDVKTGTVYVDGKALDEPYIANEPHDASSAKMQTTTQFPITVPEDCVFVMGDNRNHSSDSRVADIGTVHKSNIHGRVILRVFPIQNFGTVK